MGTRLSRALSLALPALIAGCETTFLSVSTDGRLEVLVNTSGSDLDADGFSISVDGGTAQFVPAGSAAILSNLSPGSHSVRLSGLAENCQVDGMNPRDVVVGPDGGGTVTFAVRCVSMTTGAFLILVRTTGESSDPDGYALAVAGGDIRAIGPSADETFIGLSPGAHLITLKGVDRPCAVEGANPHLATVVAGQTVTVSLVVACGGTG